MEHGPITFDHARAVAHHEAGHAVATTLRGGCTFQGIDLTRTPERDAITYMNVKPTDMPFVSYAGPWAEGRAEWGTCPLDDEDEDGLTLDDYITGAFLAGGVDDFQDMRRFDTLPDEAPPGWPEHEQPWAEVRARREQSWNMQLERAWPVIQAVAAHLIAHGTITPGELESITEQDAP
ncbi:hypothetical protein V3N95_03825 [Micrococcaceae bacterium Sec6.3]